MSVKLGIDLGTSNVVLARMPVAQRRGEADFQGDEIIVCEFDDGYLIPSYVLLEEEPVIGKVAKEEWQSGNKHCHSRFKLDIGTNKVYPSGVTPEQLTRMLIAGIKEEFLGGTSTISPIDKIEEVVVSVPHGWDSMRREATMKAVEEAGLSVKALISEPVAAAAYYCRQNKEGAQKVLVCDMGGGTFDISLVEVVANTKITVIDSINNEKAGLWADAYLVAHFAKEFNERFGLNIPCEDIESDILNSHDANIRGWLREAESVKESLNSRRLKLSSLEIAVRPVLSYEEHTEKIQITYSQLTELLSPLVETSRTTLEKLLRKHSKPDLVVLAGGMGKMLLIQEMVAEATGRSLDELMDFGVEADRAIARGTALVAYDKIQIQEILLHSIGIAAEARRKNGKERLLNHIIVEKCTPIPFETPFSTHGKYYLTTPRANQEKIDIKVVYGEARNIDECDKIVDVEFKLPYPVEKGTPYDFWVHVDENGIVKVGVQGKGVDGKIVWEGEILNTVRRK